MGLRGARPKRQPRSGKRLSRHWYTAAPVVVISTFMLLTGLAEAVPRIVHADVAAADLGISAGMLFDPPLPPVRGPASSDETGECGMEPTMQEAGVSGGFTIMDRAS